MEPSRADFCHPYQPYDIQLQFMQNLYTCIESGHVGIFESPTGTGKSLSLICGALTWLRDDSRRVFNQVFQGEIEVESDWLAAADNANRRRQFLQEREELEIKLAALRAKEATQRHAQSQIRPIKKAKYVPESQPGHLPGDEEFMLDDYDSDQERQVDKRHLSTATQALLDQLRPVAQSEEDQQDHRTKVIFCSRTHSQLTQFIHELRRVTLPPGLPQDTGSYAASESAEAIKHLPLGSRHALCVNPKVLRLSSTALINDKCLELQKPQTPKDQQCRFLPKKENRDLVDTFRNRAIATIRDIEDIADLGREMQICPYYAGRSAIPSSEIITLPYPLLLQKAAREALGVQVKGNIVIIDEAHNLMDAIAATFSLSISLTQIQVATQQVTFYAQRFKSRLKGLNRMYIAQVLRLLNSLADCLRTISKGSAQNDSAVTATQLMSGKGADQIQPHKLLDYLKESKLVYKVEGYTESQQDKSSTEQFRGTLMHVQSFLAVLMNPDSEGRFFVSGHQQNVSVKYTLLDPRQHFRDIVEDARAVILAGGTMSPMSDYAHYLFSYVSQARLETHSFGHVVSQDSLFVESISQGPQAVELNFTFGRRNSEGMLLELGKTICQICQRVPDGVVAFFPSYDYLALAVSMWKTQSASGTLFNALASIKPIFEESKDASVEVLLRDYRTAIDSSQGGLMLSVIGGKLSEGINFSDRLGRAVIVVGLPFPNIHGAEWQAKITHTERTRFAQSQENGLAEDQCKHAAKLAGQDFYENACMRAVNQSIGRVIRHRNDYAAILLLDRRFSTARIKKKLPQWILSSMQQSDLNRRWTDIASDLQKFFHNKRK